MPTYYDFDDASFVPLIVTHKLALDNISQLVLGFRSNGDRGGCSDRSTCDRHRDRGTDGLGAEGSG